MDFSNLLCITANNLTLHDTIFSGKGKNLFPRAEKQVPEKGEPRNSEIRRIIEGFSNGNLTHFYKKFNAPSKNAPPGYTGAHKKVIPEITIMASVRRGW